MARHVKSDLAIAPSGGYRSRREHLPEPPYAGTFVVTLHIVRGKFKAAPRICAGAFDGRTQ